MNSLPPLIWGQSLWGEAAFAPVTVQHPHTNMVVLNIHYLTNPEQALKGADVIGKITGSALAADLTAELTAFTGAQSAYQAAIEGFESAKSDCKAKLATRNAAQKEWKAKFKALASKIEVLADGDLEVVYSAGLDVKAERVPEQPLEEAPTNLRVATNGTPGKTKLAADPLMGALMFVVEACADPINADGWEEVARPRKPSCTVDAQPGQKVWYRIAGINGQGQSPWSDPVPRPVM